MADDNGFDYGQRQVIKNKTREGQLSVPFKNYELLSTVNRGYFQMSQETGFEIRDGIFMSGKATGGFVRASV